MSYTIQIKRDTAQRWSAINPVLEKGEFALNETDNTIKVGDGVTAWLGLQVVAQASWPISSVVGLQTSLNAITTGLSGKSPTVHTHSIGSVVGLQSQLDNRPTTASTASRFDAIVPYDTVYPSNATGFISSHAPKIAQPFKLPGGEYGHRTQWFAGGTILTTMYQGDIITQAIPNSLDLTMFQINGDWHTFMWNSTGQLQSISGFPTPTGLTGIALMPPHRDSSIFSNEVLHDFPAVRYNNWLVQYPQPPVASDASRLRETSYTIVKPFRPTITGTKTLGYIGDGTHQLELYMRGVTYTFSTTAFVSATSDGYPSHTASFYNLEWENRPYSPGYNTTYALYGNYSLVPMLTAQHGIVPCDLHGSVIYRNYPNWIQASASNNTITALGESGVPLEGTPSAQLRTLMAPFAYTETPTPINDFNNIIATNAIDNTKYFAYWVVLVPPTSFYKSVASAADGVVASGSNLTAMMVVWIPVRLSGYNGHTNSTVWTSTAAEQELSWEQTLTNITGKLNETGLTQLFTTYAQPLFRVVMKSSKHDNDAIFVEESGGMYSYHTHVHSVYYHPDNSTKKALRADGGNPAQGNIDFAGYEAKNAMLTNYREKVVNLGTLVTGTTTLDLSNGSIFNATMGSGANVTLSMNGAAAGVGSGVMLKITNGGVGNINYPASFRFADSTPPELTTAGDDILTIFTIDGGTTWYVIHGLAGAGAL